MAPPATNQGNNGKCPELKADWRKPYRTMDGAGSPTDAGTVAWNWISDLAQQEREQDAALLVIQDTPVNGGGKVIRLYRSTTLLAVATTFRDDINFTVLVRWKAEDRTPVGEELVEALRPFAEGSIDVSGTAVIVGYPECQAALERARAAIASILPEPPSGGVR